MFGLGIPELCLIGGICVLLFGGKKFAELGKGFGQGIKEFRVGLREAAKPEDDPKI